MAITKEIVYDRIEIVGDHKTVQCREATIIKEDGVELSRTFLRRVFQSSSCVKNVDGTFTHTDTDISGEPAETQAICVAVWTDAIKAALKTWHEANIF